MPVPCHILSAERLNHGIVITFEDGRCAFFPEGLLYASIPFAEEREDSTPEW